MSTRLTFLVSTAIVSLTAASLAVASDGPFGAPMPQGTAPKPTSAPAPTSGGTYSAPYQAPYTPQPYSAPQASVPSQSAGHMSQPYEAATPNYPAPSGNYYPPAAPTATSGQNLAGGNIQYGGAFVPPRQDPRVYNDPNYTPGTYAEDAISTRPEEFRPRRSYDALQAYQRPAQTGYANNNQSRGPMAGGPMAGGPMSGGPMSGPQTPRPQAKRGFWDRLGLGRLKFKNDGYLRLGDAGVFGGDDDTRNELVADAMIRSEVSAITQGGTEYGVSLKLRGQRDRFREGFGGLAGSCIPGFEDCATILLDGTRRSVKGHTGQLYNYALNPAPDQQVQLEGAHLFLRSAYGDVTLGRDDGSAALFSLGAPSTLPLARSSNSKVDYTGLDMTKTVNDASGFAEKITYTSPRLLGDQIGVGVQFGLSYAPSTAVCGVDYCVRDNTLNDPLSPLTPELDNAIEFGVALDRTFDSGLSVEGTLTYATASEQMGYDYFDDLASIGAGLSVEMGDWAFGTSYLTSNNGIAEDGDYSAFDAGLTWKPADCRRTLFPARRLL